MKEIIVIRDIFSEKILNKLNVVAIQENKEIIFNNNIYEFLLISTMTDYFHHLHTLHRDHLPPPRLYTSRMFHFLLLFFSYSL